MHSKTDIRPANDLMFVVANILVMIILHGNSRQFWPKIPYLSLRDESMSEHMRLLFNTLLVVTAIQFVFGRLPRQHWLPRLMVLVALPALLPVLILAGQRLLRLKGRNAERYNLALVPLLPILAVVFENALTASMPVTDRHEQRSGSAL